MQTTASKGARSSSRATKAPQRFRPAGGSGYTSMVQKIAGDAAQKASLPLSSDAVTALEDALEPAIQAFLDAAIAHSKTGDVGPEDFKAVLDFYKKNKGKV